MANRRSPGEGTIIHWPRRKCFRAAISVPLPTGGTKRRYFYGSKKECRDWLTQMREEIRRGRPVSDASLILIEWLRIWLARYCVNIRASTRANYEGYIENHVARHRIGGITLQKLSTDDLQEFISFLQKSGKLDGSGGLSNKTIRNMMQMMKSALKQAVGNQLIWSNAAEYCQLPKVQPKEKVFLTEGELARLLAAAKDERWNIGLVLLAMTGARLGEALSWRHDSLRNVGDTWVLDIHSSVKRVKNYQSTEGEHSTLLEVSETKTDSSRRAIPLLPEVANLLLQHMEAQKLEAAQCYGLYNPNPFLIGNELGDLIDPTTFRTWFKEMVAKAEIGHNVRIHDLRGTWATNGLKAGMSLDYVASMLGHSSRTTTARYYLSLESDIEGKRKALQHMEGLAASVL